MLKQIQKSYGYDDVLLVPQLSNIRSRKDVDLSSRLKNVGTFRLPIISSPMDTVTSSAMALSMFKAGGTGVIHRFCSVETQSKMIRDALKENERCLLGAAIGISGDFLERAGEMVACGASYICIDVAHGHHVLVKEALQKLRKIFTDDLHIMAGNVATRKGYEFLSFYGANSIRCNIGSGSICSTKIYTGSGIPAITSLLECSSGRKKASIIADGGIKNSGDIVKAFAAGADFVMLGSLLSGTDEAPGDVVIGKTTSDKFKSYRGMASRAAQDSHQGSHSSVEGVSAYVPYKGPVEPILCDLENNIRSGFSYSGARTIEELQRKAKFVQQSSLGFGESVAHILRQSST